jgi:hypothetical protein
MVANTSVLVHHYHIHVSQVYSIAGGFQRLKSTLVLFEFASTLAHSTEDCIICYIYIYVIRTLHAPLLYLNPFPGREGRM